MDRDELKFLLALMLPGLILFMIFAVYPIAQSVFGSFFHWEKWNMGGFAGLDIWKKTLGDPLILNVENLFDFEFPMGALPQNLIWMAIHVPASMFLGLGLALLLSDLKGGNTLRSIIFVGFTTPTVVIGLILLFMYDPEAGVINAVLGSIGLQGLVQNWLYNQQTAIFALIAGGIWVQTGFSMILYNSGLAGLDPALIEAAKVDGASAWQRFKDVIWPRLKPVTMVVLIMSMIWVLRLFGIVYAAGGLGGGPDHAFSVLGIEVFRSAFRTPIEYGGAITVALIELLIAIPLAVYIARMRRF